MKPFHIKAIGFLLAASTIVYVACNTKRLEIPPPTQAESNYFQTENDFRTAVIGMYSGLTDYYASANPSAGANPELRAWFLPGDDLTISNGGESLETFKNINPNNDQLKAVWKSSYVIIGRANKLLEKTPPSSVFTTPGLKNAFLGEAYFLRGFAHFQLWNLFGPAPIDTILPTTTAQFGLKSSTGTQLIDQVIADFTRATSLLPASWSAENKGRATANSAYGFLGKALTFRASYYKNNADYSAALIAFSKITGASLTTSFNDNFVVDKENNSESLFEFQAGNNITNNQNPWLSNEQCDCGSSGAYYQMFYTDGAGSFMGGGLYEPTDKLRNSFTIGDPRIQYTLTADKSKISKYVGGDRAVLNGFAVNSAINHRILRYADILLLQAEATLQSGGSTATAIGSINQVRTRARGAGAVPADFSTAQTDKAIIMGWIMDERLRELAAEGHRWFDLRRWNKAGYIALDNAYFNSLGTPNFQAFNVNFPIPSNETSVNPNITQNTGY